MRVNTHMQLLRFAMVLAAAVPVLAQYPGLSLPPDGDNQRASVTQGIGPVKLTFDYSSPRVTLNGMDRRGKIWGTLVPYGMFKQPFGPGKPAPWRTGANENTVLTISHDVEVEGKPLPAGRYGFFLVPEKEKSWTLILSKNANSWGSFYYEESEDALRVPVTAKKNAFREFLTFEFTDRRPDTATVELQWEELAVPITFRVKKIEDIYISRMSDELRNVPGFNWMGFVNAANYAVRTGKHLDKALEWADIAISRPFIGQENFLTLSTKANVLGAMDRDDESRKVMAQAIRHPTATVLQIHQVGRTLLTADKVDLAIEVFQVNVDRYGDRWPTHVGMARAWMAKGDMKKALEHARKAVEQAPDDLNRNNLKAMIQSLEQGKKFAN